MDRMIRPMPSAMQARHQLRRKFCERLQGRVTLTSPDGIRIGLSVARGGLDLDLGDQLGQSGGFDVPSELGDEEWLPTSPSHSAMSSVAGFADAYASFQQTVCVDEATVGNKVDFDIDEGSTRAASSEADCPTAQSPTSHRSSVGEVEDGQGDCANSSDADDLESGLDGVVQQVFFGRLHPGDSADDARVARVDVAANPVARRPVLRRIRTPRGSSTYVPTHSVASRRSSEQASGRCPENEPVADDRRRRLVRMYNSGAYSGAHQLVGGYGLRVS